LFISETGENSGKNKAAKESKILYRDFPEIAERSRYVADIRDRVNCYATKPALTSQNRGLPKDTDMLYNK
jgi:hypothetical protein